MVSMHPADTTIDNPCEPLVELALARPSTRAVEYRRLILIMSNSLSEQLKWEGRVGSVRLFGFLLGNCANSVLV